MRICLVYTSMLNNSKIAKMVTQRNFDIGLCETSCEVNDNLDRGLTNEIIAHFDLVAPYYKYCGNNQLQMARLIDDEKLEYREKARELLDDKLLFREEWMTLHKKFMEEFYS